MELDQGKIINCARENHFGNGNVSPLNVARRFKLTGIGIEISCRYH